MIDDVQRPGILRANLCFLIAAAGLILLDAVSPYIVGAIAGMGLEMSSAAMLCLVDVLYYVPCALVPVCLFACRRGSAGLRPGPVSLTQTFQCIAAAFLCVMLANALAGLWSVLLETLGLTLYGVDIPMGSKGELMVSIVAVAVLPGICEELLFRGMVLGAYERGGTRFGIIVSALLFAVLHGSIQGLPAQLVIGIILGAAVCRTGSIYISMMIHTAYNAFILILNYAAQSVEVESTETFYDAVGGVGLITLAIEALTAAVLLKAILRSFGRQGMTLGIRPVEKTRIGCGKLAAAVLAMGIIAVCWLYAKDFMLMMGYSR